MSEPGQWKSWRILKPETEANDSAPILLNSVTHDFRTPLTAIKASAQSLLGDGELDEASKKELLTVINEESDRLDRLVGEAARMAHFDAHAVELNLQPHHIREVIDAALETNQNILSRREVKVVLTETVPSGQYGPAPRRGDPLSAS